MAEISTGDWQTLLVAQQPWLRSLIGRQLGEASAVEDVLQETLAAGMEKEGEREQVKDLRAWLGGVARKKSQQHLRKRMRRERAHEKVGVDPGAPVVTPLEILMDAERHDLVREAMASLGREEAEILRLKYSEGMDYKSIGRALGLNHSAVTNRLREARVKLRAAVTQADNEI